MAPVFPLAEEQRCLDRVVDAGNRLSGAADRHQSVVSFSCIGPQVKEQSTLPLTSADWVTHLPISHMKGEGLGCRACEIR